MSVAGDSGDAKAPGGLGIKFVFPSDHVAVRPARSAGSGQLGGNSVQSAVGELLEMDQSKISRLERRSDMLLSTLKRFVQATDGEMHLVVTYPDGGPVELLTFSPWSPAVSRASRTFSPNSSASRAAA